MTYFAEKIGYTRECGDCTMCCQGFLPVQVYEYSVTAGNPCHFVEPGGCGKGCQIYEHRPEICQQYQCAWLAFPVTFPEWMRPNKSDVILTFRQVMIDDQPVTYLQMKEGFNKVRSEVLNWVIRLSTAMGYNLEYEVDSNWFYSGEQSFIQVMAQKIQDLHNFANGGQYPVPVDLPAQDA